MVKPEYRLELERFIYENKSIAPDSIIVYNSPNYIENRFYYNIKSYRYIDDSTINALKDKGFKVYDFNNGSFTIK